MLLFQTVVGRLLMEDKKFSKAIYVVFSKNVDNSTLKDDVKRNFKSRNEECELQTFSRSECLDYFDIKEDDDDGLSIINRIMESSKMESNMAIFFDEVPIFRPKGVQGQYNWSLLKNPKSDSRVIVSFQPMLEAKNRNMTPIKPTLPYPAHANIELTRCYRTSISVFDSLDSIKNLGIKMIKTTPESVNFVTGRKPSMMNYIETTAELKTWIHFSLAKMNCNKKNVKVLHTDNTKIDAKELFKDSDFSYHHWNTFMGSEAPVVVCFFSSELDHPWQLLNMTSRAQQQVINSTYVLSNSGPGHLQVKTKSLEF